MKKPNDSNYNIFHSDDDLLRIFLPMIDDEEQRRLRDLEAEEEGWISSVFEENDEVIAK